MSANTERKLADGSTISDLIDLERREVQLRTLADREIYEIEQDKIFGKTWLLLGHESEIPDDGNFIQRFMGDDSVIVARHKGEVFVSLNVCPHRGMKITTQDAGSTSIHKCIYHGWAFRSNGEFLGSPVADQCMHGKIRGKDELGLQQARVTLYGGLIFATWNIDGPSFEDFLGDAKWYYDMLFCRSDGGMVVAAPTGKRLASNRRLMVSTRLCSTAGWAKWVTTKKTTARAAILPLKCLAQK
jgi:phenylpropionate dioxygenase-like ring-hydroxylating dioxygenase large terminal subunit